MEAGRVSSGRGAPTGPAARRLIVTVIVTFMLVAMAGSSPGLAGSRRACLVRNANTGVSYERLQRAVDTARSGQRLTVRGLCRGGAVIGKRLSIKGVHARRSGKPTLSGAGRYRILTVRPRVSVTLRDLLLVRGKAVPRTRAANVIATARTRSGNGGAILNRGSLTLIGVQVRRSTARNGDGGGIFSTGTLTLRGATRVRGNFASIGGGVANRGVMVMNGDSAILGNGADGAGGVANVGRLEMNGRSRISRNGASSDGGVTNSGRLVMNDESAISGNSGGLAGGAGGVGNTRKATLVMNDLSSLRGNRSVDASGGGVADSGGTVRLNDSAVIAANTASACGGVAIDGKGARFTMDDESAIRDNEATGTHGGGLCLLKGRFTMNRSSTISGNTAPDKSDDTAGTYRGGGLYQSGGTFVKVRCGPHTEANVYLNTPDDCRLGAP